MKPSYIGKFVKKLSDQYCTDVRVLAGDLIDVSDNYVGNYYDFEAVEKRTRWIEANGLRSELFTEDPAIVKWVMTHPGAERVVRSVADPLAHQVERVLNTKYFVTQHRRRKRRR